MAEVKWTAAQKAAIDSRGNTLVSAAAGSGKTAALTAKIMHLLDVCPDATLGDFLIVTYTKAAAGELRERIGRLLSASATEERSASYGARIRELASADICTIHSFCMKILKQNFAELGLSPDLSVADETTAEVMKAAAMEDTIDDFFRGELQLAGEGVCDIFTLADSVGRTRDASGLDAELRDLYDKLRARGNDENILDSWADRLESAAESDFLASPWGETVRESTLSLARHYHSVISALAEEMYESEIVRERYGPAADALLDFLSRLIRTAEHGTYTEVTNSLSSYEAVTLGRLSAKDKTEASERFQVARNEVKKAITKFASDRFFASQDVQSDGMRRTAQVLRGAGRVLKVYGKRYARLKHERSVLDFSDLELLALKLLEGPDGNPTAAARTVGRKYRFVFIDEYQDTNSVQDRIFRAVSAEAEKFFVGDIKQSVYRFRGAEPEVFSGYRLAWPEADPDSVSAGIMCDKLTPEGENSGLSAGKSIFMSENFRCARPIIDFVNTVSRVTFPYGGIPFTESDCLLWGGVEDGTEPVEVCLIDGSRKTVQEDSHEAEPFGEPEYAAYRIGEMIRRGEARPEEIAIILRSANRDGGLYENALARLGIPVMREGGSPFAEESEVVLVLNILRAIDNPARDIPLAGAMMSSVFGFSLGEMVALRRGNEKVTLHEAVCRCSEGEGALAEKCAEFRSRLESLRRMAGGMSADKFLLRVYSECDIFSCPEVAEKPCGRDNLNTLHQMARTYESGVFGGLYGFLRFIDEKLEGGDLKSASGASSGVTVISIHKSKGLEYPVCFLCGCGSRRNDADERSGVLLDRELGIGLRLADPGGLVLCSNGVRDAIAANLGKEGAMEEMRVLYVALTRARRKLIVTAKTSTSPESELALAAEAVKHADSYSVLAKKRMIDHILAANAAEDGKCNLICVYEAPEGGFAEQTLYEQPEAATEIRDCKAEEEEIKKNLSFAYKYTHLQTIPSKLAVSKLYPSLLDDREAVPATLSAPKTVEETEESADVPMPKPRFMTGSHSTTPAERGTSTHVFLQFADFDRLATEGVRAELTRLTEAGFITPAMAEMVSVAQVDRMAHSPFMDRIRSAKRVIREYRFNVALPAENFTEDDALRHALAETEETVTVQGVFDCVFEEADGRLVLADYKTDSMSAYELTHPEEGRRKLLSRHKLQLSYYADAAERLFGKAPDEVIIYSTVLGEAIKITK